MRRVLTALVMLAIVGTASAQEKKETEGYKFNDTKIIPTTPVRDQSRSGTCWSYATLSTLESEVIRNGGEAVELSPMWVVRNMYFEKAVKYVRLHGHLNFAVGGASDDVLRAIKTYGIMPEEAYTGLQYGTEKPDFTEIDAVLKGYMDAVIKAGEKVQSRNDATGLTKVWQDGLNGILDAYFGERPESFTYNGKEYTPMSYAESLPIDLNDYVELTSYTHHPFYTQFALEVPDNWTWSTMWNVPMEELMATIENSVDMGYPIAWAADVSDRGFSRYKSVAIIPEAEVENMSDTEASRWGGISKTERESALYSFEGPGPEKKITQQMRQDAYDNYQTTDDHAMLIMGSAVDQNGTPYYKVQNSWGERGPYNGFYYASVPFVAYKTMSVMVHKDVLPKELRKRLDL